MTHPGNLFTPPVDLLPCPICGKPADPLCLHSDGFVVWCEDCYCAGNIDMEFDTIEEACAVWNERAVSLKILPCPVCGKPAELHKTAEGTDEYPDSGCFVVFCQDTHCAGNFAPERSTAEEAISAWNVLATYPSSLWYKSSCPACGWSDLEDFPRLPKWKRILNSDVITFSVVFGIMNVMWLRLYCQTAGVEMSLLQNLLYAVPFTLLFLLPVAVLRASLDVLASRCDSKSRFFHFD